MPNFTLTPRALRPAKRGLWPAACQHLKLRAKYRYGRIRGRNWRRGTLARTQLITDTTSDLPKALREELGVVVLPASCAFAEQAFIDGELEAVEFFARMRKTGETPRPSGVSERLFRDAFARVVADGREAVCLVMPFDVIPTFTTAAAAVLSMEDEAAPIKVSNPGVASAGLCSLVVALAPWVAKGWDRARVLDTIDEVEPECDSIFVPGDVRWLEQAGRLALIEDRIGPVEDGFPVCRVGTRITGVALAGDHEEALAKAVEVASQRPGRERPVVVTIDHAANPAAAEKLVALARETFTIERLVVTELSPTIGSQLGPGAAGIGVAPVIGGG